jgi:hypothetical protein
MLKSPPARWTVQVEIKAVNSLLNLHLSLPDPLRQDEHAGA